MTTAIREHTRALANVADGHLDAPVPDCPDWTVLDLVLHVVRVQWFWATIVEDQLSRPPGEESRPAPPSPDRASTTLVEGAERLVAALVRANQAASVWTWAPHDQTVGFITRHQVQEAAVHHHDGAVAVGTVVVIDADLAADAIDEYLSVSVATVEDPPDPPRPALAGTFGLVCTDIDEAWSITDGALPGTLGVTRERTTAPSISATASDLLLWLYRRVDLAEPDPELVGRFRALHYMD
jgi:uncharacterized protein (TIGR03083 family)